MKSIDNSLRLFKLAALGLFTGVSLVAGSLTTGYIVDRKINSYSQDNAAYLGISEPYIYLAKAGGILSFASVIGLAGTLIVSAASRRNY